MVNYSYDAWGNHKVMDAGGNVITDTAHIGNLNPFRYRGYFYDRETGLYYLKTRYYDPQTGRFINMDSVEYADPSILNSLNFYTYSNSNPSLLNFNQGGASMQNNSNGASQSGYLTSRVTSELNKSFSLDQGDAKKSSKVLMGHITTPLINWGAFLGQVAYVNTVQFNENKMFYSFSDVGGDSCRYGLGIDWGIMGVSVYASTNKGVGFGLRLTPHLVSGLEISLKGGVTGSFGIILGNTTHEISISIGWGAIGLLAGILFSPATSVLSGPMAVLGFVI